jgi:hypothetical protein
MKEELKDNIWTTIILLCMFGYLFLTALYLK